MVSKLILGDCLEKVKDIPDGSVDAVICDPPYGLSFMGKKWDYEVPSIEIWKEALRVLKPGGYLLSFGGTRTYHRMVVSIEDAGFEIRDMIAWVYGSGFPKSLNIGKAVDKLQGNERKVVGTKQHTKKDFKDNLYAQDPANRNNEKIFGYGKEKLTKGTSEWEGWGTALKPALEPICVARRPLSEKTVAENCLRWGTGGMNIDGCRVATEDKYSYPKGAGGNTFSVGKTPDGKRTEPVESSPLGRFPANLIHDGSDEVMKLFPKVKSGGGSGFRKYKNSMFMNPSQSIYLTGISPSDGSAARFFYCAKASKAERNRGCEDMEEKRIEGRDAGQDDRNVPYKNRVTPRQNQHPTVKPIALMQYLVKLISREGATILDSFMGSGTTGIACKNLNRNFIGIELDPTYFKIAQERINNTLVKLRLL